METLPPMSIHHAAAKGFQSAPDAYDRGRPDYPPAAVKHLVDKLNIRQGKTVVEVGSGTGKFTRLLVPTGARIIAVEPVPAMRDRFEQNVPEARVVNGTAELMPVGDAIADAIVVAQAFHWFHGPGALREFHCVLRPGGMLGLLWNARDESVGWVKQLTEIMDPYEGDVPRYRSGAWREAFLSTKLFSELEQTSFRHVQRGPPQLAVDRVLSVSFMAALPKAEQDRVAQRVRDLVDSAPETRGKSEIEIPYRTDVFTCRSV